MTFMDGNFQTLGKKNSSKSNIVNAISKNKKLSKY